MNGSVDQIEALLVRMMRSKILSASSLTLSFGVILDWQQSTVI